VRSAPPPLTQPPSHAATPPTAGAVLAALAGLRPGASCCPGTLARRLGTTPGTLRPILARLAAAGRVRITQQGRPRDLATLRGPYRVAAAP
jgi:DNA-binding MarR family transcriptional regulator